MKNTDIIIINHDISYKGNTSKLWSNLYNMAYEDNFDYFVQLGDDIKILDKDWVNSSIKELKKYNDIGVVGFTDMGRKKYNPNDSLFTQTFVSKKHMEIFGFYFPPEIKSWCTDNWIGDIYDIFNLKLYIRQRILNCGGEPRYDIPLNYKEQYIISMNKYKDNIKKYMDNI